MPLTKDELVKKVGFNIRSCRKAKNISIEELAFKTGLDYSQICRIERGEINTGIYHIFLLANSLDIPIPLFFIDI